MNMNQVYFGVGVCVCVCVCVSFEQNSYSDQCLYCED